MPLGQTQEIGGEVNIKLAAKVDEGLWNAIFVEQVSAQGTLVFDAIYEVESHIHHYTIPVTLPIGLRIQGRCEYTNTSSVYLLMKTILWFIDPDGVVRGYNDGSWNSVYPGNTVGTGTKGLNLDKPGTWTLHGELHAEVA